MDFSKYLLVSDLDGTFFAKGGTTVPRNLEALARFREGGGLFTVATGRLHLNIRVAIPSPEEICGAPLVMCNGAYLYDFRKKKAYFERRIPAELAREILEFTRKEMPDLEFRVSTPTELRVERLAGYTAEDAKWFDKDAVQVKSPAENWPFDDWYKIVYRGETERLREVRERIEPVFGQRLSITKSGKRILELQPTGSTKAAGVEELRMLMAKEGQVRRIIACGDFENDIEMLRAADIAVCPSNALEQVRKIADHVLCNCNDGLIADVIEGLEKGTIV